MAMWSIYGELLKQSHTISCVQTDSESSHVWALACLIHTMKDSTKTTFHMSISICSGQDMITGNGQEVPRF